MKVVCIGSGNVATHIASALKQHGNELVQIWSKQIENASELAKQLAADAIDDLSAIDPSADLYIIAVKDDAISTIASRLKDVQGLVVHTSGATSIDVLAAIPKHAVLYPLQTFSKTKSLDFFNDVPLCIESGNEQSLAKVKDIAHQLSASVYEVDSAKRKVLHLAAVFACNFVNHLYAIGSDILEQDDLHFDLLKPLIRETAAKVQAASPKDVQTGPAIRNDEVTIQRHLALLNGRPDLQELYKSLSKSIKKTL